MRHIYDDGNERTYSRRVSTDAGREQIAFQPRCSLPIHNADRKSVGNGARKREQRTCRNKTCLRPPSLSSPASPCHCCTSLSFSLRTSVILTTRQDVHTERYNRESDTSAREKTEREREKERVLFIKRSRTFRSS